MFLQYAKEFHTKSTVKWEKDGIYSGLCRTAGVSIVLNRSVLLPVNVLGGETSLI